MTPIPPPRRKSLRALPRTIWALGFGSMFMDISSELVHSLLPIFMVSVLGASMTTIGFLEGAAEATGSITKIFSGVLSDYVGKRKPLLILGYGLGAITKPLFPLATSIGWIFSARFVDRIGKGIRGAPRDALIADVTPPEKRGAAYGLRQSLDTVGAFVGPLLAVGLMAWFANNIKAVLWVGVIPAFIAVGLLSLAIREPRDEHGGAIPRLPISFADARRLPQHYWFIVVLGGIFTMARFSEAFLVLRASNVGLAIGYVPVVMVVMNVVYAVASYPAGLAADRLSRRTLLVVGLGVLVAADLTFAAARAPSLVFVGAALWGLHMGLTQGLLSAVVADAAPPTLRGTAFGIFNLVGGASLLLASVIAGALWTAVGPSATFVAGAIFAALAGFAFLIERRIK
ncbi:MAG: MFS transporter [Verrucomicrobiota bacterium]|nr:MFS transporter [Verrucomicrobiota bacterium]